MAWTHMYVYICDGCTHTATAITNYMYMTGCSMSVNAFNNNFATNKQTYNKQIKTERRKLYNYNTAATKLDHQEKGWDGGAGIGKHCFSTEQWQRGAKGVC